MIHEQNLVAKQGLPSRWEELHLQWPEKGRNDQIHHLVEYTELQLRAMNGSIGWGLLDLLVWMALKLYKILENKKV